MSRESELIERDIDAYLRQHERKQLLQFLTCGSVDDGKSTLIGRLLYDSQMIHEDQLAAVRKASATRGTADGGFDPALLTDGLKAEREQGITIDVAYRYFATDRRKFIIADTPGHEQYTRNMATGASNCDLAIILVDARRGVLTQTRRHSFIVSLLGIRHVVVAINKMDLVGFDPERYEVIRAEYEALAVRLGFRDVHFIPMSALAGDNVVESSQRTPWYEGEPLLGLLNTIDIDQGRNVEDLRFPVQYVIRPNPDFRGFAGTLASGVLRKGQEITVLPSGVSSRVRAITTYDGDLDEAVPSQSVTVLLEDELDCSRGDMIVGQGTRPTIREDFDATVVWMAEDEMVPRNEYLFKLGPKTCPGAITSLYHRIDVNTLERHPASSLGLNEIGRCRVAVADQVVFDAYRDNRWTGSFVVIDRMTNGTVGMGMIAETRRPMSADHWVRDPGMRATIPVQGRVTSREREARYGQRSATVLFTGLPGSGKTTIAHALERRLFEQGRITAVVDGAFLRKGMSSDLGFSAGDRSENLRRGAEIAKLLNDSGLLCLCAFVAPSEAIRGRARALVGPERFIVVHLDAPAATCRQRHEGQGGAAPCDGADGDGPSEYETPREPDLVLPTDDWAVSRCVDVVHDLLVARGIV